MIPHAARQLNTGTTSTEPRLRVRALHQEKPHNETLCTATREQPLLAATGESHVEQRRPSTAKNKQKFLKKKKEERKMVEVWQAE